MDEAAINLDPVLQKCWMKKGQQRLIPMPENRPRAHHIFGGYNWRDDTVTGQLSERRDSEAFIVWLEHLMLDHYPESQVVLVMDNVSFHKSHASKAAISLFENRMRVLFLPEYSPNLNPIERYWRHLKGRVCANKLHPNMDALRSAIVKELMLQNDLSYELRFQTSD